MQISRRLILVPAAALLLQACLWADWPERQLAIHDLAQQADVIVVARLQSNATPGSAFGPTLQVTQTIKGQLPSSGVSVTIIPSPFMTANPAVPADVGGASGLWFLKRNGAGWQVLPLFQGDSVSWRQQRLPLPDAATTASSPVVSGFSSDGNPADQSVLSALVSWYESLPNSSYLDDSRLLDLTGWNPADALAVVQHLTASSVKDRQALGLAAALRLGSDAALSTLAQQPASLQSSTKFFEVTDALANFYRPNGESSITPLQALIAARANVPGLGLAAGTALRRIRTKNVLPAMAMLLDSEDPQAQLRAISYFVQFAVFAKADGSFPSSGAAGPFWTPDIQAHQPRADSTYTQAELVSFWKSWWASKKSQLGFQ